MLRRPPVSTLTGALFPYPPLFRSLGAPGIVQVGVNVHYLADALEAHLKSRPQDMDIRISDERAKLLETGGGVVHALPLIGEDPFYIVNSDNLWVDGPVDTLRLLDQRWNDDEMDRSEEHPSELPVTNAHMGCRL